MKGQVAIIASFMASQIMAFAGPLDGGWTNTDSATRSIPPEQLAGVWRVTTHDGNAQGSGNYWIFTETGQLTVMARNDVRAETSLYHGSWEMHQSTVPRRLDFRLKLIRDGAIRRSRMGRAIARMEGDQLTLAIVDSDGPAVPANFEAGPGVDLIVLQRVKEQETETRGPTDR